MHQSYSFSRDYRCTIIFLKPEYHMIIIVELCLMLLMVCKDDNQPLHRPTRPWSQSLLQQLRPCKWCLGRFRFVSWSSFVFPFFDHSFPITFKKESCTMSLWTSASGYGNFTVCTKHTVQICANCVPFTTSWHSEPCKFHLEIWAVFFNQALTKQRSRNMSMGNSWGAPVF